MCTIKHVWKQFTDSEQNRTNFVFGWQGPGSTPPPGLPASTVHGMVSLSRHIWMICGTRLGLIQGFLGCLRGVGLVDWLQQHLLDSRCTVSGSLSATRGCAQANL